MNAADQVYLARAIELARRAVGNVSPNPPVGAVLVDATGRTLGEGYHHVRGGPHAEVEALRDAQARGFDAEYIRGATMYVSLEPCNHFGRTPPCSEALVAAGVARAVIGTLDPNPRTAGGGVARLRDAAIVAEVAGDADAREVIASFARRMETGRPFVTLKIAASLNGMIAPEYGRYWLTGEPARKYVRELRAAHDAVMIGAGTARIDDPQINVRPARTRVKPLQRIIVSDHILPDPSLRVFSKETGAATILCVPTSAEERARAVFSAKPVAHVAILAVDETEPNSIDCRKLMKALGERDISEILCEGGPTLAASLLASQCVDRVAWLIAPTFIGTPSAVPALGEHAGIQKLLQARTQIIGEDILVQAEVPKGAE